MNVSWRFHCFYPVSQNTCETRVKHVFSTCFPRVKNPTRRRGVFSRRRDVFFRMKGACFPVEIPCFWGFGEIHFIHFYPQFEGGIGWNWQFMPCSPLISIFPGQLESFDCCILIHDAQGVGPEPGNTGNIRRTHAENGVKDPELFGAGKGKSQVNASQTGIWKRRRTEEENQGDILPSMYVRFIYKQFYSLCHLLQLI